MVLPAALPGRGPDPRQRGRGRLLPTTPTAGRGSRAPVTTLELTRPRRPAGRASSSTTTRSRRRSAREFDIAAASQSGQTTTCVVQSEQADLPDLTLTISKTSADADVFKSDVVPDKGATAIKGLGLAAYQAPVAAAKDCRRRARALLAHQRQAPDVAALHRPALDAPRAARRHSARKLVALAKQVETVKATQATS